ncbi:GGDEF domain-containing protein [Aurantimonas sp. VKM B-3413]|uniref:GGDEF domain-containing protein n=1 Tax=Aurantimonas sp. VKM B-3413 TaxID=2779401 RepID=UPI001E55EE81|nr:GGDEF domain-containing protein [Aurantimonas sp. VKM B-3413]MCB8838417.1 GGDEF domain-containing protein [Aurantimonas sp. VKM B-3413]
MNRHFTFIKDACGEFMLLVAVVTLASVAFTFATFQSYGQDVLLSALLLALGIPLASAVPYLIFLSVRMSSLMTDNDGLQRVATTDRLTGVLNRQGFDRKIRRHIHGLVGQTEMGLLVLIVDADHFKRINDRLGHPVGDQALKKIAATLHRSVRGTDAVGRLGGEEFVVSLPCTDPEQGMAVAERLRQAINRLVVGQGANSAQLSVSIGGAFLRTPQSFDRIYAVADANLYRSKQDGRNRCTITSIAAGGRGHFQPRSAHRPIALVDAR